MSFSDTLRLLREEKNVTQKEVAEQCGLTATCICQLESGARNPTGSTIKSLSMYFHVSSDYLLGLEDDFGGKVAGSNSPRSAVSTVEDLLTPEERKLIVDYRKLDKVSKRAIERTASSLAEDPGDKVKQLFGENKR